MLTMKIVYTTLLMVVTSVHVQLHKWYNEYSKCLSKILLSFDLARRRTSINIYFFYSLRFWNITGTTFTHKIKYKKKCFELYVAIRTNKEHIMV